MDFKNQAGTHSNNIFPVHDLHSLGDFKFGQVRQNGQQRWKSHFAQSVENYSADNVVDCDRGGESSVQNFNWSGELFGWNHVFDDFEEEHHGKNDRYIVVRSEFDSTDAVQQ